MTTDAEMYGADAAEWLKRWDNDDLVWTIDMGGMGPGYEQCIQIMAAEILRHLLKVGYDKSTWKDKEVWRRDRDKIEGAMFANDWVKKNMPSGAQLGAAMSLATSLYMRGPIEVMNDPEIKDRHIQARRVFPSAA
jgi:hypothetical protein